VCRCLVDVSILCHITVVHVIAVRRACLKTITHDTSATMTVIVSFRAFVWFAVFLVSVKAKRAYVVDTNRVHFLCTDVDCVSPDIIGRFTERINVFDGWLVSDKCCTVSDPRPMQTILERIYNRLSHNVNAKGRMCGVFGVSIL
jgi:hypothetical protein